MKKTNYYFYLAALIFCMSACGPKNSEKDTVLKKQIGQMLILGFRGTELTPENHIVSDIQKLNIAGVALFDYDVPSQSFNRNIINPVQLKKLNDDLQNLTNEKLIISVDQEGSINRLKEEYGFPALCSAQKLGYLNDKDSTEYYASLTAEMLKEANINVNFSPCVDVNINPECPVIGLRERSFSADPAVVVEQASWWLEEQQKNEIIGCLKHFPGHGSSAADTHLGVADVTQTWQEEELLPYKELIKTGNVHLIMTSHIFNAKLDEEYPATMSEKIITGILREQFNYDGVIITDDLAMGALVNHYSLEEILEKSILAGADLLCLSNNGKNYDPEIAGKAVDIIFNLVKTGKISEERIQTSYDRIQKLKEKI